MIYDVLLNLIMKNKFEREDMLNKLDVFFAAGRITQEQYLYLVDLVNQKQPATE